MSKVSSMLIECLESACRSSESFYAFACDSAGARLVTLLFTSLFRLSLYSTFPRLSLSLHRRNLMNDGICLHPSPRHK